MKITWFGDAYFRIYFNGHVYVVRDSAVPKAVDERETEAGASQIIHLGEQGSDLSLFDPQKLESRRPRRVIDEGGPKPTHAMSFANGVVLADQDEPPLIVVPATSTVWGDFADGAVIILGPENLMGNATALFAAAKPKLLALAIDKISDAQFAELAAMCRQTALQVLEPGMALEA